MTGFDFVDAAAEGYRFAWRERQTLLRLAALPLLVKAVFFIGIAALGMEENFLRQGLMLIPAYFVEGWLVAQAIRLAIFGSGDTTADPVVRRCITASMLVYVLTKILVAFVTGMVMAGNAAGEGDPSMALRPDMATFFTGILIMGFIVWSFRFLWLYVPAAMGIDILEFLKRIRALMVSFHMLGLWFLCFVPVVLALVLVSHTLLMLFPGTEDSPSDAYIYLMAVMQAVAELAITVISGAGMAFAIRRVFSENGKS